MPESTLVSGVYRRQILTIKAYPRTVKVETNYTHQYTIAAVLLELYITEKYIDLRLSFCNLNLYFYNNVLYVSLYIITSYFIPFYK